LDREIEDGFQLLTDFSGNNKKILKLLKEKCKKSVIFSGVFGNFTGIKEIYRALTLQSQIIPFVKTKILKKTSYKNVHQYNGVFELVHIGQLRKELRLLNLLNHATSNIELLNLFINTTPRGETIEIHCEITYVYKDQKIVFINLNTDPLEIIRQIEPQQIEEEVFATDPLILEGIKSIQSKLDHNLTPMEIQCLSFALCSFSSKQTASYLFLSHRTIETYLQNAHVKIGCRCKGECLEIMYKNGLIREFQHLCYQLMEHPELICRST
jgi:DNA-binding CsgD family transcriptional regulator